MSIRNRRRCGSWIRLALVVSVIYVIGIGFEYVRCIVTIRSFDPLLLAAWTDNMWIARRSVTFAYNLNVKADHAMSPLYEGATPLIIAIRRRNDSVAILLIHGGCDVDITDRNGASAIRLAIENNNASVVRELIRLHANLDEFGDDQKHQRVSMIEFADMCGALEVKDALINKRCE